MSSSQPSWPNAAVFDFDGLLVDSAACWHDAYDNALGLLGRTLDSDVLKDLAGASVMRAAQVLQVEQQVLREQLLQAFQTRQPSMMPGAVSLVEHLASRIPLAIATNAPVAVVSETQDAKNMLGRFRAVISAEAAPNRDKPSPDVYRGACRELGVSPSAAIAFEDSPPGALAARSAGLTVVYVPSDGLVATDVDLLLNTLDDPRLLTFLEERAERA